MRLNSMLLLAAFGRAQTPLTINLPKDASADMVVTFRNLHKWMTLNFIKPLK